MRTRSALLVAAVLATAGLAACAAPAQRPSGDGIVVEPFWCTSERPPSVENINGWVRDAAERYDTDYIPDASTWIQGREGEMASDGPHPGDEGYAKITRLMDAALRELGL